MRTHTPTHTLSLPTVEPPLPPAEPLNGSKPSNDVLDLPPDNEPPPLPSVPLPEDEPVSVSLLHSSYHLRAVGSKIAVVRLIVYDDERVT